MRRDRISQHSSDADLVCAHLAGNVAAWEALLERYERFIFRLILSTGLAGADAEDAFQNVCLKLYLHLEDLREVARLSGWLAAVVRQEVFRFRRRRRPETSLDTTPLPEMTADQMLPEEMVLAEERANRIRQALIELPEPCRQLLTLLYGPEPASYEQISTTLEMPPGSIGPRRARCLERLKKIIEKSDF